MNDIANRDWLIKEEAEAFVGENGSYYLEKWKSHSESKFKGWNWAAMLFSVEWMAYRKMYFQAILFFLIVQTISCGIVLLLLFSTGTLFLYGKIIGDLFRVLMGALGNLLYRKKALGVLQGIEDWDAAERIDFFKRKGGVSFVGLAVCIVIEIIYSVLFLIV